jgi:poly(3-hydroxybutyrate) depolymerase
VGHYGVFNGSRFRSEIAPRIADFILNNNGAVGAKSGAKSGAKGNTDARAKPADRPPPKFSVVKN